MKFIDVFNTNVVIKEIFVNINLNSRAVKYKTMKQIKFSPIEVVETLKKFKKLIQIIKKHFDFVNIIK